MGYVGFKTNQGYVYHATQSNGIQSSTDTLILTFQIESYKFNQYSTNVPDQFARISR